MLSRAENLLQACKVLRRAYPTSGAVGREEARLQAQADRIAGLGGEVADMDARTSVAESVARLAALVDEGSADGGT